MSNRLIVGITGASGVIYGIETIRALRDAGIETHLLITDAGRRNIEIETEYGVEEVEALAHRVHSVHDLASPLASGSFITMGMIVAPCTIKTLSAIASSYNENLLIRAADVTLKEGRRLILMVRETPLHLGHLRLMMEAAQMGAFILPPIPVFYHKPKGILDMVRHTVGKALDLMGIEHDLYARWGGRPRER